MPYTINGEAQSFDEPVERNGITYVPLAGIVEVMGGYVTWDNTAKVATVEIGGKTASVQNDAADVDVNGSPVSLPAPAFIQNNKLWVPVQFFQDVLGLNVAVTGSSVGISQPA